MEVNYTIVILILLSAYASANKCAQGSFTRTDSGGTKVTVECEEDSGNSTPEGREIALLDCALNDREDYATTFSLSSQYFPGNLLPKDLENIISGYVGNDIQHIGLDFLLRRSSNPQVHFHKLLEKNLPNNAKTVPGTTIKTILDSLSELVYTKALAPGFSTITLTSDSTMTNPRYYEYFEANQWKISTKHDYLLDRPFLDQRIIEGLQKNGFKGFTSTQGRGVRILFPTPDTTIIPVDNLWAEDTQSYHLVGALYAREDEPEKTIALIRRYQYQLEKNSSMHFENLYPFSWWKIIKSPTVHLRADTHSTAYALFLGQKQGWQPIALFYRKFEVMHTAPGAIPSREPRLNSIVRDYYYGCLEIGQKTAKKIAYREAQTAQKIADIRAQTAIKLAALGHERDGRLGPNTWRNRIWHNRHLMFWGGYTLGAAYCYYKKPHLLPYYSLGGYLLGSSVL